MRREILLDKGMIPKEYIAHVLSLGVGKMRIIKMDDYIFVLLNLREGMRARVIEVRGYILDDMRLVYMARIRA